MADFYNTFLHDNPQISDYLSKVFGREDISARSFSNRSQWLKSLLDQALLKDQPSLRRGLKDFVIDKGELSAQKEHRLSEWLAKCLASISVVFERSLSLCKADSAIPIADQLPVGQQADEIAALLEKHQVIVVAGETGSGKTTQLPKICARLGRGLQGRIGHTQPRRLAARTVAARIADELGVELGEGVAYQFRFEAKLKESSRIKLMTDGILLSAVNRDRLLLDYDTLIIDEAHERSLTIDFLLGYLKTILPRRPELKIIITSATIDVERFASFFAQDGKDAPVVMVEGRSYPVEHHYLDEEDLEQGFDTDELIARALEQIENNERANHQQKSARDVLVFLPGEREIRDVRQFLQDRFSSGGAKNRFELLPLYARLSRAEQNKLFQTTTASRRIILATNVAETSITVPNIGYVIDSGLARISRYSARSKLQRLQIEKVSQASANQRAGRCGRIAEGECYRLYSEDDFNQRSEFTDPEILRTHLAEVILQMTYWRLGNIHAFPFVDKPESRQINAGFKTLEEIGALQSNSDAEKIQLSDRGKKLAQLPLDPRLAVILLAAQKHHVLPQVLVIVAALAVVDPREFPEQKRQQSRQLHSRFVDKRSDFLGWLNLWIYVVRQRENLTSSQWRKRCKQEFLSWLRLREWREVHRQLLLQLKQIKGIQVSSEFKFKFDADKPEANLRGDWRSDYEAIHRSLLAGLYSQFGLREEPRKPSASGQNKTPKSQPKQALYQGARNRRFAINPGSTLHKGKQPWVVAGEIVETKKVYARTVAAIEASWLAEELPHLIRYDYAEPYWDKKRGQVMVSRSAKLYGMIVAANQKIACERYDKKLARKIFIQEALANRELEPDKRLNKLASFWGHNEDLIEKALLVEAKLRRRDVMLNTDVLVEHYQQHLPENIWSRNTLAVALKSDNLNLLCLKESQLQLSDFQSQLNQYPSKIEIDGQTLSLRYSFAPGDDADGVSCLIPLGLLQTISPAIFEWLVPGMLLEKIIAMIKALPKAQRRALVPAPQVAERLWSLLKPAEDAYSSSAGNSDKSAQPGSLYVSLCRQIEIHFNLKLNSLDWQKLCIEQLEPVYHMRFEVIDAHGKLIGSGRDLIALQAEFRKNLGERFKKEQASRQASQLKPVKDWQVKQIGRSELTTLDGIAVKAFPVLQDQGDAVSHGYELDESKAFAKNRAGILRLAVIELSSTARYLKKQLFKNESELLGLGHILNAKQLREQVIQAAIAESCFDGFIKGLPANEADYKNSVNKGRGDVVTCAQKIEKQILLLSKELHQSRKLLDEKQKYFPTQKQDIEAQLSLLLPKDFCLLTPAPRFVDLVRYVKAIGIRMDRIGGNQSKDDEYCEKLSSYQQNLQRLLYTYVEALSFDEELCAFRWLLEELRVALFAQQLKTREPASFARLEKAWQKIDLHRYPEAL